MGCPNCGSKNYARLECRACGFREIPTTQLNDASLVFCGRHQFHMVEGGEAFRAHQQCPLETVDPRTGKRRLGLPPR